MINREWKQVTVKAFSNTTDEYGQLHKGTPTTHTTDMVVKIYNQSNVANPLYVDVTDIGLTKDNTIVAGNEVIVDTNTYQVLYVIPSSRLIQVLMKRKWQA